MSVYIAKDNKGKKRSDTPTDLRICNFLHKIISENYDPQKILDPCAGDRRLTNLFNCKIINFKNVYS